MKNILFVLLMLLSAGVYAQNRFVIKPEPGKVYVTRQMDHIEFYSDSTLNTSLGGQTYRTRNDTLFLGNTYNWYEKGVEGETVKIYDYKILFTNNDTIVLRNRHLRAGKVKEDTLTFVNLEKLKEPVKCFKKLIVTEGGYLKDSARIEIGRTGKISFFIHRRATFHTKEQTVNVSGHFSGSEFTRFKNVLGKALLKNLPASRECAASLGTTVDFTLVDKSGKSIFSTRNCTLYRTQEILLNYLNAIDTNAGFIPNP